MNYDVLMSRIYTFGDRIKSLNGEVYEIIKKQPASDKQIKDIEEQLHVCLPGSFKKFFWNFQPDSVSDGFSLMKLHYRKSLEEYFPEICIGICLN